MARRAGRAALVLLLALVSTLVTAVGALTTNVAESPTTTEARYDCDRSGNTSERPAGQRLTQAEHERSDALSLLSERDAHAYYPQADPVRTTARQALRFLAPRTIPALRQAYADDVASIADDAAAWRKAGADPEFIAREAWANRRAVGMQYKNLTPAEQLAEISARNLQRYGDRLGPSIDWLRAQGKTWEQIIESATRTGGKDLGF